jgi:Cys-rich protein (TIGR01571 family)
MESASYQPNDPGSDAPAFSTVSQSSRTPSEIPALYPPDHKRDLRTFGTHLEKSTQYGDSITPEDARYLRKQAGGTGEVTTSPDTLPVKSRRELHPPLEVTDIVPDENPLAPKVFNSPNHERNFRIVPDSTIDEHLPGQAIHVNHQVKGGTWKYGLCDCGDIGVCCTGVWCPCVIYGKTQYRLSRRSERKDPTNMLGYSTFNGSCATFAILCGCNLILAAIQHSRLRKAYDIPGGVGTDFVRACCCCCCTLSQDEKEIKYRETQARSFSGSARTMQYSSPKGMNFSPPPK